MTVHNQHLGIDLGSSCAQDQWRTNALHVVVRIQSYPSAAIFLHGKPYILLARSGITNRLRRRTEDIRSWLDSHERP